MAGKLCDGVDTHIQKQLINSRAFCEGRSVQIAGGAGTDNPEDGLGTEREAAWDAGFAAALAGDPVGCCAE